MTEYKPRIMISGETAGTGGSTTSKILSEALGLPNISGGKYFRGLANRFDKFITDHKNLGLDENYQYFLSMYEHAYKNDGLNGVNQLVGDGFAEGAKGDALAQFGAAIERNYEKTRRVDKVWDYAVEQNTILEALSKPGYVWEAKIAILALELDQMQSLLPQNEYSNTPYFKLLLTIDPKTAAELVGFRESRVVTGKEITQRRDRDFARFGELYTINGKPVRHSDLSMHAHTRINTKNIEQVEVANEAIRTYLEQLHTLAKTVPMVTPPLITHLSRSLPITKA